MNKYICDVCREHEANHRFKVKRLQPVFRGEFLEIGWARIDICDICDSCYHKLLRAKRDKEED